MLYRKIAKTIEEHFASKSRKILLVDGARQVGKTFIIRYCGGKTFSNFVEINLLEDKRGHKYFEKVRTKEDFYLLLSALYGNKLGNKEDTLVFLDEIQEYPELLTLLKFLSDDGRYTYIASGSLLGVALSLTSSIPIGSIRRVRMYPLDFEEFLIAMGVQNSVIDIMRDKYTKEESLEPSLHSVIFDLFQKYLIIGGMPDAVNEYIETQNIQHIREIQREIHDYYSMDASKYSSEHKLKIQRIYSLLPSLMENKKKRVVIRDVEDKKGKTFLDYQDEFEYLIGSGISLVVSAVSNPVFPLNQSETKNLLKLYFSDVGILSSILYGNNVMAIIGGEKSINLGALYETVVAEELISHSHKLFYYDNKKKGEVDYLINDYDSLSIIPVVVKSGRDYVIHSALSSFCESGEYNAKKAFVLSNERLVKRKGNIVYLPIYYVMFI